MTLIMCVALLAAKEKAEKEKKEREKENQKIE
jgi:hypothetical protein